EHGKARALVGADRQHHAAQGGLGIAGGEPIGVERIAEGDFLASALGAADLAARGHPGDISRRKGGWRPAGAPAANGLVPSSAVPAPQGGMAGDALLNTSEINPASSACST